MLPRRTAPADPESAARVRALLGRPGWVPPTGIPPAVPGDREQEQLAVGNDLRAAGTGRRNEAADERADDHWPGAAAPVNEVSPPEAAPGARGLGRVPSGALDRWRGGRVDPGRRGVAALGLVAVLAAGLAAVVVLRGRPAEVAAPPVTRPGVAVPGAVGSAPDGSGVPPGALGATSSPGATSRAGPGAGRAVGGATAGSGSAGSELVVSVAGKVAAPGLVRLPPGSRVDDAVRAAGGLLPGVDPVLVNGARRLVDGEQILVGVPQPVGAPAAGAGPAPAAGPLDLNAATVAELDALPGIGPVLAQRIVDWRTAHGRFGSVDQLREVGGIGESKFVEIKPKVRV